ncbi:MAG: hypothetical protein JXB17_13605 [Bacteroidales bacterium]|nr:hypothetical protein [Bacteroidales bacterium]
MERKNINRGFKQLRVWQDAIDLYILTCECLIKSLQNKIKEGNWDEKL